MVIGATAVDVKALPSVAAVTVEPDAENSSAGVGEGTACTSWETTKIETTLSATKTLPKVLFFIVRFPQSRRAYILEKLSTQCLNEPRYWGKSSKQVDNQWACRASTKWTVCKAYPMENRWNQVAVVMGAFLAFAGVMHFISPQFFNDIVPPWLPPNEAFWTYLSGVAELVIAWLLLRPQHRRTGAIAAIYLFIGVYPANLYMAWDWRDRVFSDQVVAYGRLPFQFLFIWLAVRIVAANPDPEIPAMPGDVTR